MEFAIELEEEANTACMPVLRLQDLLNQGYRECSDLEGAMGIPSKDDSAHVFVPSTCGGIKGGGLRVESRDEIRIWFKAVLETSDFLRSTRNYFQSWILKNLVKILGVGNDLSGQPLLLNLPRKYSRRRAFVGCLYFETALLQQLRLLSETRDAEEHEKTDFTTWMRSFITDTTWLKQSFEIAQIGNPREKLRELQLRAATSDSQLLRSINEYLNWCKSWSKERSKVWTLEDLDLIARGQLCVQSWIANDIEKQLSNSAQ